MRDGDVIISTVRTYLKAVAPIKKSEPNLIVSTGFAVVRPKADLLCPAYAGYLLLSEPLLGEIVSKSVGVSYPAVNPEDISDLEINIPLLPIQKAIATYLDKETARIDALIEIGVDGPGDEGVAVLRLAIDAFEADVARALARLADAHDADQLGRALIQHLDEVGDPLLRGLLKAHIDAIADGREIGRASCRARV